MKTITHYIRNYFDISLIKKIYFGIKSNNQKIIHFYIRERINFEMKNRLDIFFFPDKFEIYKKNQI